MKHLNEEELVEHYYKSDARAERHLARCAACAEAFVALHSDLAAIEFPALPNRDAAYGERVWESISASLPRLEAPKRNWLGWRLLRGLSYASAFGLLLACAFYAGRQWEHGHQPRVTVAAKQPQSQPAARPPERVVVVVLSDHLDRSERLLVELKHADADSEEMIKPLRDQARSLLVANQLCRRQAKKQDDPALDAALERLDRLFNQLANQPDGLTPAAITRLQDQLNSDSLLFEVRVLRSKAMDHEPPAAARSYGGTI
ncbi:MAG: hypothetical protein WB424_06580 [Terracidiphilus sp.]